ncbi:SIS domain-containing protein [Novosphingobium terrae]|uniref:SIS domain-containing protein n=1 Tax=Novosphingobium terrae TaxID=2726189 RepID=UPI00198251B7|nr:SIS domain-containing protein [Novosphingobium terrae]
MTGPDGEARSTLMFREAAQCGQGLASFLERNRTVLKDLGARLRDWSPSMVVTCARGSSDNAATYGKYLIETRLGLPVSSAALSVSSVFEAPLSKSRALCLAISQSGRSPDLLTAVSRHQASGALVVALVNDEASPLADMADVVLPLSVGPELSVAATKSCLVSMAGITALVACWAQDDELDAALDTLPAALDRAFEQDWSGALPDLAEATNLFVVGRGFGFGVAQEAALKLKETCALHAEAFSAAEVRHGPMTIVGAGFPILALATSDAAGDSVRAAAADFAARGAHVHLADPVAQGISGLPAQAAHPAVEPLLQLLSFYRFANDLSLRRGLDPDSPPHLAKVTCTV